MADPKTPRTGPDPWAYMGVGAILLIFGISMLTNDGSQAGGLLLTIGGAVALLIGAVMKANIESRRDGDS